MSLTWDKPRSIPSGSTMATVSGYQIRQKKGSGSYGSWGTVNHTTNDDNNSYNVTGLTNGETYTFQVRAVSANGNSGPSGEAEATPQVPAPAKPAKPTAEAGNKQVTLFWTDPGNANIQKYQYEKNGDGAWENMSGSGATTTTYTVKELQNGAAYTFKIRAVTAGGEGPASDASDPVTPNLAPGQPQNFRLEPGNATMTLRWDDQSTDAAGIAKWQYKEKVGDADWPTRWNDITAPPGVDAKDMTSIQRHSLTNGTRYGYRLRAVATGDVFGQASEDEFATPAGPPAAVPLTAVGEPRQVTLSWTVSSADESVEKWQYQQVAGATVDPNDFASVAWSEIEESDASTRSHTVLKLTSGSAYSFRVRAVGYGGDGAESNIVTATPTPGPAAAILSAEAGARRVVSLSWTLDADASINKWQFRKREGDAAFGDDWTDVPGSAAATRSHTLLELTDGVSHGFQVRAVSDDGDGAASNVATATPAGPPAAATLTAVGEPRQVALSWTLDADDSIENWQYQKVEGATSDPADFATATWTDMPESDKSTRSHTVLKLTSGSAYSFRVRAVGYGGDGAESNIVTATPTPGPAAAILSAEAGARRVVSLSWTLDADTSINKWQFRKREGDAAFGDDWTDVPGSAAATRSHTLLELTDGVSYGFQVRAVSDDGDGAASNIARATPAGPPAAATLTAVGEPRQVALSWTLDADDSIENWQYQKVEGATSDPADFATATWTDMPESDKSTRSHTLLELASGSAYSFRVRAVGYGGDGVESNIVTATPPPGPAAAILSAEAEPRRVVALSWTLDADDSINRWQFRKREGDAAFGDDWTDVPGSAAATRSHTLLELTDGVSYGFQVRAVSDDGDGAASNVATATPTPRPAVEEERRLLKLTLAAVARATLSGAVETLSQRFDAAPCLSAARPALALAGSRVGGGLRLADRSLRERLDRRSRRPAFVARTLKGSALLRGSAFSLPLAASGAASSGPAWSVWGRGDWRSFEGATGAGRYDGSQRAGWLGLDGCLGGRFAAGLALSQSDGESDYRLDSEEGRVETALTALWPYLQLGMKGGGQLRLVAGAGRGEAEHRPAAGAVERADLAMLAASVGGRLPVARRGAFALAATGQASLTQLETDDAPSAPSLGGLKATGWRLSAGLEAAHDGLALGASGWRLQPRGALAVRQDGGDGLAGTGAELSAGARLSLPGGRFGLDASGHWLALHSEDEAREWGASLEARLAPGAGGRGLSLAFGPQWGQQQRGALTRERLFDETRDDDTPQRLSLTARAGYGFATPAGLLTPFAEWRLPARYAATGLAFTTPGGLTAFLTAEHHDPDTRLGIGLRFRF